MTRYCWRFKNAEYRIPAASQAEAERILCYILGVSVLPQEARFIGCLEASG